MLRGRAALDWKGDSIDAMGLPVLSGWRTPNKQSRLPLAETWANLCQFHPPSSAGSISVNSSVADILTGTVSTRETFMQGETQSMSFQPPRPVTALAFQHRKAS
ncbi:hypothetical protein KIL84_008636 [Mauremys mutica]|uniref:Uncharacterized protein n=1 Tax=Mauremys mutica TaxID=74926 RepID=A0A9D4AZL7_9SAUR|nr:hypothetical protein KIL84_008636 [Mauremys mutica]